MVCRCSVWHLFGLFQIYLKCRVTEKEREKSSICWICPSWSQQLGWTRPKPGSILSLPSCGRDPGTWAILHEQKTRLEVTRPRLEPIPIWNSSIGDGSLTSRAILFKHCTRCQPSAFPVWALSSSLGPLLQGSCYSSLACPKKQRDLGFQSRRVIKSLWFGTFLLWKVPFARKSLRPSHRGVVDHPKFVTPRFWHLNISFLLCKMLGQGNPTSNVTTTSKSLWLTLMLLTLRLHSPALRQNSLDPRPKFI